MTEDRPTYDELVAMGHRIEARHAELIAHAVQTCHTVRYVGVEAPTFEVFVERLNEAHATIIAAGGEYELGTKVPNHPGDSWQSLLTVKRKGLRPRENVE